MIVEIAVGIALGFAAIRVGSVLIRTLWEVLGTRVLLALPRGKSIPRWYWLVTSLVTGRLSR